MERALYAYAVLNAGAETPRAEPILPGAELFAIEECGLAALASAVPRAPFEAGPGCRTEEPDWLADRAALHHGVIAATRGAVLPLAFGAVFSGEAPLRDWIRARAARLSAALEAVAGCAEWAVMLEEDIARHEDWLTAHEPGLAAMAAQKESAAPGTAFLLGRRFDRALLQARQAHIVRATEALGEAMAQHARRLASAPARGADGVAAWALLLRDAAVPDLRALLEEAADTFEDLGLSLRLSGPWPPYAYAREAVADA